MRILSIVWRVLNWSPFPKQALPFRMQYHLLSVLMFFILLGWNDNIWYNSGNVEEGDPGAPVQDELTIDDWNAEPLDLGNGECMIVTTREISSC
jgi:hypothetical protein